MARQVNKMLSYFVIPSDHRSDALYDLVVNRDKRKAYFSYPMTDATEDQISEAQNVMKQLEKDLVMFDPYTIKDPYLNIELEKQLERARVENSPPKDTLTIQLDYSTGTKTFTCPISEIRTLARVSIFKPSDSIII